MNDYQELAMRTRADGAGTHNNVPNDLIHAVLGLMDELHELSHATTHANHVEELGDILWFCALGAHSLDYKLDFSGKFSSKGQYIADTIMKLAGLVKRSYAYGKELDKDKIASMLQMIVDGVFKACDEYDAVFDMVKDRNIAKLRVRYPDKYEDSLALNRNLEAELVALGG